MRSPFPYFRRLQVSKISHAINLANRLATKKPHVVIAGYPSDEGNALEVVRALQKYTDLRVFLLVDNPQNWTLGPEYTQVELLKKNSVRAMRRYLTSRLVFFTHGLYGQIKPIVGRQVFVNLWHGDGLKEKPEFSAFKESPFPANLTVGTSKILAAKRASDLRYPENSVVLTGAPRLRLMHIQDSRNRVRQHISKETGFSNFVLWMPTFRNAKSVGRTSNRVDSAITQDEFARVTNLLRSRLHESDTALIAKFHPLEASQMGSLVDLTVTDQILSSLDVSLYELIGATDALVTDYSSIWIEYLLLDRPIGFIAPDLEEYQATRGLFPHDVMNNLPGPLLDAGDGISQFLESLRSDSWATQRSAVRNWLELVGPSDDPAKDLLTKLSELTELKEMLHFDKDGMNAKPASGRVIAAVVETQK